MMKEFKFHVPVDGLLSISIVAEDVKSALDILIDKKEAYEQHPLGKLNLKLEEILAIESNPKTIS